MIRTLDPHPPTPSLEQRLNQSVFYLFPFHFSIYWVGNNIPVKIAGRPPGEGRLMVNYEQESVQFEMEGEQDSGDFLHPEKCFR